MSEVLEPIFGESGVVAAQFLITLLLVLLILAVAVWLFGQIARLRLSSPFRGKRARRLSQVEAIAVDGGRRAILLRLDNTEHLILIGGPTDIVVEHSRRDEAADEQPAREPQARPAARAEAERHGDRTARRAPPAPDRRQPREEARAATPPGRGEGPDRTARPNPPARQTDQSRPANRPGQQPGPAASQGPATPSHPDPNRSRRDLAVFGHAGPGPGGPAEKPADRTPPLSERERQEAARITAAYAPPNRTPAEPARPASTQTDVPPQPEAERPSRPAAPQHADAREDDREAAAEFVAAAAPARRPDPAPPADTPAAPAAPTGHQAGTVWPVADPASRPTDPNQADLGDWSDQEFRLEPLLRPELEEWPPAQPHDQPAEPPPLVQQVPPRPQHPGESRAEPVHPPIPEDDDQAASAERVGRLEEEMARLLGEISNRRRAGS